MNKNILFITSQFPPFTISIGGVIRVFSFIQSLNKKNNVYVLSGKSNFYGFLGIKNLLKKINIKYISNSNKNKKNFYMRILYYFFNNFFYLVGVDGAFADKKKYLRESLKIIKNKKIDYIILSGPPFSLFFLVKHLKNKHPHIKIILDYRDGWTSRIERKIYFPLKYIIEKYYESFFLRKSNYILCATKTIFKKIKLINKNKNNVILLTNGFSNLQKQKKDKKKLKTKKDKKINIGYFGLISDNKFSYRDINIIYDNLKTNNIIFNFFGNSIIKNKKFLNYENFSFFKNIDYQFTNSKMQEMDYLLILHTEKSTAKEVITGKFYEYLKSKTPIIVISEGQTECGNIVKNLGVGYDVDYSKISLSNFFLELGKYPNLNKKINLKVFSRDFQNKKLVNLIK